MKNKKFDELIGTYFDSNIPTEPDLNVLKNIKSKINDYDNAKKSKNKNFWKVLVACSCIIIIITLSILLPILLRKNNSSEIKYYAETDIEQSELTLDFVKNYINENFSVYNFLFEEFSLNEARGVFLKTDDSLLAIKLSLSKINFPFTNLNINLIFDNNYLYSKDKFFRENSQIINNSNNTVYKKNTSELYTTTYYILIEYSSLKIYIEMDVDDEELLNKFL